MELLLGILLGSLSVITAAAVNKMHDKKFEE